MSANNFPGKGLEVDSAGTMRDGGSSCFVFLDGEKGKVGFTFLRTGFLLDDRVFAVEKERGNPPLPLPLFIAHTLKQRLSTINQEDAKVEKNCRNEKCVPVVSFYGIGKKKSRLLDYLPLPL